jgi:hypothetical protein
LSDAVGDFFFEKAHARRCIEALVQKWFRH